MRIRTANNHRRRIEQRLRPDLEDRIYAEQWRMIADECGNEAANKANYGWAVIDETAYVDVCTKVYGFGRLCSIGDRSTGRIKHEWQ